VNSDISQMQNTSLTKCQVTLRATKLGGSGHVSSVMWQFTSLTT